ncbi:MAG: hypothetical protein FJ284_02885 [Planctomycetes bacterium]|nr:hypothetical protein [Planctomycetota bacterium]
MTPIDDEHEAGAGRMPDERQAAELATLRPRQPSAGLRARIAAELPARPAVAGRPWAGFGERLAWAVAGAAAVVILLPRGVTPSAASQVTRVAPAPMAASQPDAPPAVTEESIAWSDEGVRFLDDVTPARILRRRVVERHAAGDGRATVRLPREDLILLPVAIR